MRIELKEHLDSAREELVNFVMGQISNGIEGEERLPLSQKNPWSKRFLETTFYNSLILIQRSHELVMLLI